MTDVVAEVPCGLQLAKAWYLQMLEASYMPNQADLDHVAKWCYDPGPCNDCATDHGQPHDGGCDVARCLWTGRQRLACSGRGHDCGQDLWDGVWPGTAEAIEYGWYSHLVPGWGRVKCGPWNHGPGDRASPDLNRVPVDCDWDREKRRWVLR